MLPSEKVTRIEKSALLGYVTSYIDISVSMHQQKTIVVTVQLDRHLEREFINRLVGLHGNLLQIFLVVEVHGSRSLVPLATAARKQSHHSNNTEHLLLLIRCPIGVGLYQFERSKGRRDLVARPAYNFTLLVYPDKGARTYLCYSLCSIERVAEPKPQRTITCSVSSSNIECLCSLELGFFLELDYS